VGAAEREADRAVLSEIFARRLQHSRNAGVLYERNAESSKSAGSCPRQAADQSYAADCAGGLCRIGAGWR